jgi:hypothetical protein
MGLHQEETLFLRIDIRVRLRIHSTILLRNRLAGGARVGFLSAFGSCVHHV